MKWRKSASDNILPGVTEERFLRAAREYVASAFPNPERRGCPGHKRLDGLARRKSPPDQKDIDHVVTCSDCFVEYQTFRKAWKRQRAASVAGLVAAALAVMVFSGILIYRRHPAIMPTPPAKPVEVAQEQLRKTVIDLRPFERVRGQSPNNASGRLRPPVLERKNLLVTIQLPTGSAEGPYVFQLVDSSGSPQLETSGNAAIKDYVTTAEAPFDLRGIPAGRFTLTVRGAVELASASYVVEVR